MPAPPNLRAALEAMHEGALATRATIAERRAEHDWDYRNDEFIRWQGEATVRTEYRVRMLAHVLDKPGESIAKAQQALDMCRTLTSAAPRIQSTSLFANAVAFFEWEAARELAQDLETVLRRHAGEAHV